MNILRIVLRFATSTRVAIGLMAILALLSLVGATVPQGQGAADYVKAYGEPFAGLVWNLRLDHVFRTTYYFVLLVALCAMVVACSLKSLSAKVRQARPGQFISDADAISRMSPSATLLVDLDLDEAQLHVVDILRKRFYGVRVRSEGTIRALVASKAGFSRFGSSVLHLSFIFLLAGSISIMHLGARHYENPRVGETFELDVAGGGSVTVTVENFDIEFDQRGNISDFLCDVALRDQRGLLLRSTIRPNHPLRFKSREVYLTSYEQDETTPEGFVASVFDSAGALVIPHLFIPVAQPAYVDELAANVQAANGIVPQVTLTFDDGRLETHTLSQEPRRHGESEAGQGRDYAFELIQAVPSILVTLEVVKEPGQWLIIAGLVLLTIGAFASLYLSHRLIWFILRPAGSGKTEVVFACRASRNREGMVHEFDSIRRTLDELA